MSFYTPQYPFSPNSMNPDVFSSQSTPYNFYFNPVNVVYEPFLFSKRIARLDFDFMGKINVNEISSRGDVQSIMQLLYSIVFANITQVEAQQFGSKGALHSFMILQMAVEYYLNVVGKLSWEIHNLRKSMKNRNKTPPDFDQRIKNNYESQIQILKNDVEKRDLIIDNLSEKYQNVRRERDSLKCQLENLKKRATLRELRPQELKEEEKDDLSDSQLDFDPKIELNTPFISKEPKHKKINRNPRSVNSRPKHSSKPIQPSDKTTKKSGRYKKISSLSTQHYSDDFHELLLSSYSSASSSGWT